MKQYVADLEAYWSLDRRLERACVRVGSKAGLLILMISLCTILLIVNVQAESWDTVASPTSEGALDVFMVSTDDGWAVGWDGTIIRWDGASWSTVTSPTTDRLNSVFMVSASNGWAVGDDGRIIRWDGASWSTVTSPTTEDLYSVFMVSASDGWAVGSYGTIIRWNGASWSTVTGPIYATHLESVFMVSASDGWAVGTDGTIIRWNGASWSTVTGPTPATPTLTSVFMVSASNGWAVGWDGRIIRWDGASWSTVTSPTTDRLTSVFMVSASNGWAVGGYGRIIRWDGASWSTVTSPINRWLWSVFMVSASDGWAVGSWDIIRYRKVPPDAFFTSSPEVPKVGETVNFDASGSSDSDGTIVNYAWDFGDGNSGTGKTTTHSYSSAGSYTVKLTVADNDDLTDTETKGLTIPPPGQEAPVASFIYSPSAPKVGETVSFDASGSSDSDGTIANYAWDFGDGTTGTGVSPSHVYEVVSPYTVTLTVTDNDGLTGTTERSFDVYGDGPQPNGDDEAPPIADARASDHTPEVGTTVTFNGGGSSDNVGVVSYEWNFGDGNIGTGETATHTYTKEDTYTVTLTVTDAAGNWDKDTLKIVVGGAPAREEAVAFPLWVLAPIIGGITGITAILVYLKKRKPKEEVMKPAEPVIAEEVMKPAEPVIAEEVMKPTEEIPPQKVKEFPKLTAKCCDTITLLNSFIEDPSPINDRKAWKSFKEFITIAEQIEDEYAELIEIRNKLAILRRKRKEYRSAGLDDLADRTEGLIQRNYGDSIRIIKEIQEKLPQLGN